jgi:hypothetical protein
MTDRWMWLPAPTLTLALAGGCNCGSEPPVTGNPDVDGGAETDGGTVADGGGQPDDGEDPDGGEVADAGTDAGVTPSTICQDVAKKKCDWAIRCKTPTRTTRAATTTGPRPPSAPPARRGSPRAQAA